MKAVQVVALVAMVGCYTPEFTPCTLRCSAATGADACPPGLTCLDDSFCHGAVNEDKCPCLPLRCEDAGGRCGMIDDGCNGTLDCGCTLPDTCGGGGSPDMCGHGACQPEECPLNTCGPFETCGMMKDCATCAAPTVCGGAGTLDQCGTCSNAVFMPGFPAMNCGTANPWYCSNINACLADQVNCLTRKSCPGESGEFFCPCGMVISCVTHDCVPGVD